MSCSRFSTGGRAAALLALAALGLVFFGPSLGFASDSDAPGERCVGCPGCESGECGDEAEHPAGSHHHCCTTCCMSHTSYALPSPVASPVATMAERLPASTPVVEVGRIPDTPYRPPRV